MRKSGVISFVLCFIFLIGFTLAVSCTNFSYSDWNSCSSGTQARTVTNSTPINCTGGSPVLTQNCTVTTTVRVNTSSIDKGFDCLVQQIKSDCTGAATVQEIALSIMASPNNTEKCVKRLKTFAKTNCFGTGSTCSVKDTALAIVALNHAKEQTSNYISWLKNQTRTSTDLIWQLEQDSIEKSDCEITYDSQEYPFSVLENKKITSSAGNCFSLTQSDYWFQISPSCYDKEFSLVCNTNFLAALMYKTPNSQTLYLLSSPQTAAANNPVNIKVKSTCFGTSACDYEASLWAVLALKDSGENIDEYIPYLISAEELNSQYLPSAFLHMIVDWSDYGTKLIKEQKQTYWEADSTAYDKYYDTSLALIALSESVTQQQVANAKSWLSNFAPGPDGCWGSNNKIRDSAIALWAIASRPYSSIPNSDFTGCTEASPSFSCINSFQCAPADKLPAYVCGGVGKVCCRSVALQSCSEIQGIICSSGKICDGVEKASSDSAKCCTSGVCKVAQTLSSCELESGSCETSCSTSQTESSLDCGLSSDKCCLAKEAPAPKKSLTWLWILLIILIIIIAILIVFRERVQLWWFKVRNKVKEDRGNSNVTNNRGPPPSYPGMRAPMRTMGNSMPQPQQRNVPPIAQQRVMPASSQRAPVKKSSSEDDDVFKKLKDMGK